MNPYESGMQRESYAPANTGYASAASSGGSWFSKLLSGLGSGISGAGKGLSYLAKPLWGILTWEDKKALKKAMEPVVDFEGNTRSFNTANGLQRLQQQAQASGDNVLLSALAKIGRVAGQIGKTTGFAATKIGELLPGVGPMVEAGEYAVLKGAGKENSPWATSNAYIQNDRRGQMEQAELARKNKLSDLMYSGEQQRQRINAQTEETNRRDLIYQPIKMKQEARTTDIENERKAIENRTKELELQGMPAKEARAQAESESGIKLQNAQTGYYNKRDDITPKDRGMAELKAQEIVANRMGTPLSMGIPEADRPAFNKAVQEIMTGWSFPPQAAPPTPPPYGSTFGMSQENQRQIQNSLNGYLEKGYDVYDFYLANRDNPEVKAFLEGRYAAEIQAAELKKVGTGSGGTGGTGSTGTSYGLRGLAIQNPSFGN